jgi:hypothetical protein
MVSANNFPSYKGEFFRANREKQLDWLATNTDDITTQSHSCFACSREKNPQDNMLYSARCFSTVYAVKQM